MPLTYNKLTYELLKILPELNEPYKRMVISWEHMNELPGVHIVFGDIFAKYIINYVKNTNIHNISKIKKIFNFIEKMVNSKDFEVRSVAEVSVLESLIDNNVIDLVCNHIKPITLKKVVEIKKKWGNI